MQTLIPTALPIQRHQVIRQADVLLLKKSRREFRRNENQMLGASLAEEVIQALIGYKR